MKNDFIALAMYLTVALVLAMVLFIAGCSIPLDRKAEGTELPQCGLKYGDQVKMSGFYSTCTGAVLSPAAFDAVEVYVTCPDINDLGARSFVQTISCAKLTKEVFIPIIVPNEKGR